ncbi:hypothetical protein GIB67_040264 [Kingdonia uniflora]|uniref:Uncharacterized protein n=1 Tax=Kingdonia uniflora TaxID=39325 RepID=A0A7J7MVE3_9MAGN|nr:hypothetical protein GIB67_040264 [Kingdonia uniflora]
MTNYPRTGEQYRVGYLNNTSQGDPTYYLKVEAESLPHLSAKYCPLVPPPRSTIAAAFCLDGKSLASTYGDHTVKIIDCQTGSCLKVLSGHRRTPWVVRFHPLHLEILASGSLDHEVRLWDANTTECIGSRGFYRPIASIAFHAQGEVLAVASGHKVKIIGPKILIYIGYFYLIDGLFNHPIYIFRFFAPRSCLLYIKSGFAIIFIVFLF